MSEQLQQMSEAEYLAWSERQELTYEFDGIRPVAMNGGTVGHERVRGNLQFALRARLRGSPCEVFGPSTRVPTGQGRYRFPDALVTCTRYEDAARDVAPVVIFEVASTSTLHTDRGAKLMEYRSLPSLVRYVMLEQGSAMATVITRVDDHWQIDVFRGEETLALPEIGIELPLAELYAGVTLLPDPGPPPLPGIGGANPLDEDEGR